MERRAFLRGSLAAPFVARLGVLMPVKSSLVLPAGLVRMAPFPSEIEELLRFSLQSIRDCTGINLALMGLRA